MLNFSSDILANGLLFLISLAASLFGLILYRKIALKFSIVDKPNFRSSHSKPVIRGAGIVIGLISLAMMGINPQYSCLLLGISIVSIVGFVDDLKSLNPLNRVLFYTISLLLVFYQLGLFVVIQDHGAIGVFTLLGLFVLSLGTLNAYNFMDGINGITTLYSLVFLSFVYFLIGDFEAKGVLVPVIAFFLAFSLFNVRTKAQIFLGDAGSVAMGLFACFLLIYLGMNIGFPVILLISVYGVDSVGTIVLRLMRKKNIFEAHRMHVYQQLTNEQGLGHVRVSVIYSTIQILINLSLHYALRDESINHLLYTIVVLVLLTLLYLSVRHFIIKDLTT